MRRTIVILRLQIILFLLFAAAISAQTLSKSSIKKLDPRFQALVSSKTSAAKTLLAETDSPLKPVGTNYGGEEVYGAIIRTSNANAVKALGINVNSQLPSFVTARVTPEDLVKLAVSPAVQFVLPSDFSYPFNDVAAATVGADLLHSGYFNGTQYQGSGVILCIIDTGIDWDHLDFRDPTDTTKSRILYIWDQTLTKTGAEQTPQDRDGVNLSGLNYGVEYTNAEINDEIDGTPAGFVRETDTFGHGTHVAGTAAGNGASLASKQYAGMAPLADILIVKAGNGSFTNNNVIDGLTYAKQVATALGKPLVVNMSLGGQSGPHDGTSDYDLAIDNFVGAGRVAVIAAGNSGSSTIHIAGSVAAAATANITITVPSYSPNSGTQNDYFGFDWWFDSNGSLTATVTSPNTQTATQNDETNATTATATDGSIFLANATASVKGASLI